MKLSLNHDMNGWFKTKFKLFHISSLSFSKMCVFFSKNQPWAYTLLSLYRDPLSTFSNIFFTVSTHTHTANAKGHAAYK